MAGGASGAASGAVLGIVVVILAQQFGFIQLSDFTNSLTILLVTMVVLGVIFGLIGRGLKGRAIRKARGIQEWKPPADSTTATPAESPPTDASAEQTEPKS